MADVDGAASVDDTTVEELVLDIVAALSLPLAREMLVVMKVASLAVIEDTRLEVVAD